MSVTIAYQGVMAIGQFLADLTAASRQPGAVTVRGDLWAGEDIVGRVEYTDSGYSVVIGE